MEDLDLPIQDEQMPFPIIVKGELYQDNLKRINRTEKWLEEELRKQHIPSRKDILLLCANDKKVMFIQLKERKGDGGK